MRDIKAEIEFASFFSYRVPDFSSQYALSSLLPSPLAVKLALVSTAIQYRGKKFGEEVFEIVKNKEIHFKLEGKVVVNNFLIKRLKAKKEGEGLDRTFGIRGYVFFEKPIEIWINIENNEEDILDVIKRLRYLGTSDSVCSVKVEEEKMPQNLIVAKKKLDTNLLNSIVIPTKDLTNKSKFEEIDIYNKKKKPRLDKKYFQIPIKQIQQSGSYIIYEV